MIHSPTAYGLSARSIGMANASTVLTEDVSAIYFNPAAMAMTDTSKIALTYIYGQPSFQGGPKGKSQDEFNVANKLISLGLVMSMDEFLKSNRKIALGLNITLDDNGQAFIRFDDLIYENGYYSRYGPASFVFNAGLGFEIMEWFYFGGGVLTTLHSNADFYVDVDLAGRTEKEGMRLDAEIVFAPLVSLFFKFDPVSIGIAYRGETSGEMLPIKTTAVNTVGGSKLVDLPLDLLFKDSFCPSNLAIGIGWDVTENLFLTLDGTWYGWGRFDQVMSENDLVRDDIDIDMVDTYVPRFGLEYQVVENLFLRFGYSYETSPLRRPGSNGNYMLDNTRHIGSLGLGYDLDLGIFNHPISFDTAFFHYYLAPRELESSDGTTLESQGNLSGGTASITIRF